MKKILTKEITQNLKTEEDYKNVAEDGCREIIKFLIETIGTVSMSDEPLLVAALEIYAKILKENMRDTELKIYEKAKQTSVEVAVIPKPTEE